MSHIQLLQEVKNNNEDFEWYPTTKEIVTALYAEILKSEERDYNRLALVNMLDIGAGDGNVFRLLKKIEEVNKEDYHLKVNKAYAIEKSQTLINAMPDNVFTIGTDFWQTTLVDKKVDIAFSNPPYSEYEDWSEKIIKEAHSKFIYLVVPQRWKESKRIKLALEKREAEVTIVGTYSFENSEFRKARAIVNLIKISLHNQKGYKREAKVDPFALWFKETYPFTDAKPVQEDIRDEREKNDFSVVKGDNLVLTLEALYSKELMALHKNYTALSSIDNSLLKELGVSKKGIQEGMKMKIGGLKTRYWKELFDNLDTITSRLTKKSREKMLKTLNENTAIDFTASNAYSLVIWAIKNANKYFDEQLIDTYETLSNSKNIINYKSNARILNDDWRYLKEDFTHYVLDYRIVLTFYGIIGDDMYSRSTRNGLGTRAAECLEDILTVADNLGFPTSSRASDEEMKWVSQHKNNFFLKTSHHKVPLKVGRKTLKGNIEEVFYMEEIGEYQYKIEDAWYSGTLVKTKEDIFMEVKAFKNGNMHIKFSKKFMGKMNIVVSKLKGWIKSPEEASEEFSISPKEASVYFASGACIPLVKISNLLPKGKLT